MLWARRSKVVSSYAPAEQLAIGGIAGSTKGPRRASSWIGDAEIEQAFEINLAAPGSLDVSELADEISEQAVQQGSAVWKPLREKRPVLPRPQHRGALPGRARLQRIAGAPTC